MLLIARPDQPRAMQPEWAGVSFPPLICAPSPAKRSKTVQPMMPEPARTAFDKLRVEYREMGRRSGETRRAKA
jgi:hypothetical protein